MLNLAGSRPIVGTTNNMRPELLYPLFSPVTRIKGVGPQIAQALARVLEAEEGAPPIVRDLLFHLPGGLIDRRRTYPLASAPEGETATFVVTVESHHPPPRSRFGSKKPYKVICRNDTGDLTLVFFHASADYLQQALPVGGKRVVSGRTEKFDGCLQITHPDVIAPVSQLAEVQRLEPVYPLTAGLTNKRLAGIIQTALAGAPALPEWLPAEVVAREHFASWNETLKRAHAPQDEADLTPLSPARRRLAYDEILAQQLHLALLRGKGERMAGRVFAPSVKLRAQLLESLPFSLTGAQQSALAEIDADMASGARMARLLQGDVGSGKTLVALMAALSVAEAGAQAAIMAPTELIAQQHTETIRKFLDGLPVQVALLTGSVKGRAREETLAAISEGRARIVIGTQALFQEKVEFHDLALMVVDEQHRFGVAQRMALSRKGAAPHLLQMSATPIPRSLTMTLYGDMDCSLLLEKPAGRKPVTTAVIPLSRAGELTERLRAALARGEKAYWICPMIEESEASLLASDTAAAETRYRRFADIFGTQAGLVHGRMPPEAREAAMRRFAGGEHRLLVATTVVEVGVDVSDATIIIIERAERFGLAQLHQLRGRVGRGEKPSSCVLLYSDGSGEEARGRLSSLRESNDGFFIAEKDLQLRGGGDLLGTRQSGMPRFRFTDLLLHAPLIAEARAFAAKIARENNTLEGETGKSLKLLLGLYGYESGY